MQWNDMQWKYALPDETVDRKGALKRRWVPPPNTDTKTAPDTSWWMCNLLIIMRRIHPFHPHFGGSQKADGRCNQYFHSITSSQVNNRLDWLIINHTIVLATEITSNCSSNEWLSKLDELNSNLLAQYLLAFIHQLESLIKEEYLMRYKMELRTGDRTALEL